MTWHTNNSTHSTSSQEREAAFSLTSYLDTIQSELAKSRNIQEMSYSQDNETESCQAFRSGTTSAHLTASLGADSLTSFAGDSPAKEYLLLMTTQKDSTTNAVGCGLSKKELLLKWSPESHLWKTVQCLFVEDLEESSVTFPRSGMFADGLLWEATKPALAQTEKGSGFTLQRPTASDGKRFAEFKLLSLVRPHHPNGNLAEQLAQLGMKSITPKCAEILMRWPEGWSDLKPLATDKIQSWLQKHSLFFQKD